MLFCTITVTRYVFIEEGIFIRMLFVLCRGHMVMTVVASLAFLSFDLAENSIGYNWHDGRCHRFLLFGNLPLTSSEP